jgi:hypothetical protein
MVVYPAADSPDVEAGLNAEFERLGELLVYDNVGCDLQR